MAGEVGGQAVIEPDLLAEVTNLVEAPLGIRGSFDPEYLELPREVLISVMKKHQRYFPVEKDGQLLPYFIAVTNRGETERSQELDLIIEGNEHVIRPGLQTQLSLWRRIASSPWRITCPRLIP